MGNKRYKYLFKKLLENGVAKDDVIVDCACGDGFGTNILINNGWNNIMAYDISYKNVSKANRRGVKASQADICYMPCDNNIADVFICSETLEHILSGKNTTRAVEEIKRVCKDNGLICITVPEDEEICLKNKKHQQYLSLKMIEGLFEEWEVIFKGKWCKKPGRCNNVVFFRKINNG